MVASSLHSFIAFGQGTESVRLGLQDNKAIPKHKMQMSKTTKNSERVCESTISHTSQTFLNIQTLEVCARLESSSSRKVTECINIQTGHVVHCDVTKGSIFLYSVCRHGKDMWTLFWNCQSNSPEAEALSRILLDWDSLGTSKRTTSFFFFFFWLLTLSPFNFLSVLATISL